MNYFILLSYILSQFLKKLCRKSPPSSNSAIIPLPLLEWNSCCKYMCVYTCIYTHMYMSWFKCMFCMHSLLNFATLFLLFKSSPRMFIDFRERGRGERENENRATSMWERNTHWLTPVCSVTGDQTHNVFH